MIKVEQISKSRADELIFSGISFTIERGEMVALTGASGCGKTTLLRCIQGLEPVDFGHIVVEGRCGLVFQDFHLFRNQTVLQNICFAPMQVYKQSQAEVLEAMHVWLEPLHLMDKLSAYPHALSGGQKQRVALVRALAMCPDVLLLDEPISALDAQMAKVVMQNLSQLSKSGMTVLLVSHQMSLARQFSDRILHLARDHVHWGS